MLDKENYVARLRAIAVMLSNRRAVPVAQVLAEGLAVQPYTPEFFRRVVLLVELAHSAKQQVGELTDDPSRQLYGDTLQAIVTTFETLDMRENWPKYWPAFDTRPMTLLETCELAIEHHLTMKPPPEAQVKEELASIQEAISTVLTADMEAEAKQILLEVLRDVERALLAYSISGLAGLRRAVERSMGAVVIHKATLEQSRAKEVIKKTFKVLASALTLLRNVDFVRQLPEKAGDILKLMQ